MNKCIPPAGVLLACWLPMQPALAAPASSAPAPAAGAVRPAATVTGRVTDKKGEGLPGVTVLVKGSTTGTSTDGSGNYSLSVPDNGVLVFSSVGYTTQEVPVLGRTSISITLSDNEQQLNEVVVLGYVSQDRQNLTSAAASVDAQAAKKAPAATITEGIQGRAPGVQVQNSGVPGQNPNILVRGAGTINSGSSPLYVIDGLWTDNIRDLNPQDVASLTVLRDASSTAIYGSKGANGVVIITTKRGRPGAPALSVNAYGGAQNVVGRWDLMNAAEWAAISRMAYQNAGRTPMASAQNPQNYADTDWQSAILRQGTVQSYDASLSGGGSGEGFSSNYLVSGSYFRQKGALIGTDFERYTLRLNSGLTRGRFRLTESLQLSHAQATLMNGQPFQDAVRLLPTIPVYATTPIVDPKLDSGYGIGSDAAYTFGTNPVAEQEHINSTQYNNRLQGALAGEFNFTSFLSYKLNLSVAALDWTDRYFRKPGRISYNAPAEPGFLNENRGDDTWLIAENTLNFNKSFGENHLNAVVGYSEQYRRFTGAYATNRGYTAVSGQYFPVLDAGTQSPSAVGYRAVLTKRSYFGQVVYDYKNRYLLTGSYRVDGSSQLADHYNAFYAGSVGWRVSEEEFFKGSLPVVSNLKPRFSYGVNGNDAIGGLYNGGYLYTAAINTNTAYVFNGSTITNWAIQVTIPSSGIRWERRYFTNYGLDLGFFNDRLTMSADYYVSRTKDALINPPLPIYLGSFGDRPYSNFGEIENRGFEFQAAYQDNRGAFSYGISGNLTTLTNKVLATDAYNSAIPSGVTRTETGYPLGSFYLIQFDGIFQTQDEVNSYRSADGTVIQPYAKPGDVRYRDANGDGRIDDKDRVHTGTPFPTLQYGLSLNAAYKGFDFSILVQGVSGNTVFNVARATMDRTDDPSNYRKDFQPWTPQNHSTTTPRALQSGGLKPDGTPDVDLVQAAAQNAQGSTRFLESGAYLRGKNVQLGYTFPKALVNKNGKGLTQLRLYVTAQNFFTVTNYSGPDPEFVNGNFFERGVDFNAFPNLRTFTGGIQLGF